MLTLLSDYIEEFAGVFSDMAPYFLFGLTVAGILHVLLKKEFILKHLQKNSIASVIKAALVGIPLPLCSCGVVPTALSLRKNRASEGATVSFLIATPQTGVDSIAATYGLLGLTFAVFTPFAALFAGIMGGFVTLLWRSNRPEEYVSQEGFACNLCLNNTPHRHSLAEKTRAAASYAYKEFLDDISMRLLFGIAVSALIALLVPDDFFTTYLGNDFLSMLVMIIAGVPLYICATASIPIALALIDKGLSPGAALVFLTVGPATNAATITLIASEMGRRVLAIYLGVISIMAIVNGTVLNVIYRLTDAPLPTMSVSHLHHMDEINYFALILTILFTLIFAASLYRRTKERLLAYIVSRKKRAAAASGVHPPSETTLAIEGMTCNKCRNKVTLALRAVPGVSEVEVEVKSGSAKIQGTAVKQELVQAVEKAGYAIKNDTIVNR
ncbi:MAG: SO_0444 family Cu/Zn efflux transporter [Chitinispirillaceae bacterium]|nr:SO_0444 family Cu/Zn efflux transporter [Chitinispirillaceae bacterium]